MKKRKYYIVDGEGNEFNVEEKIENEELDRVEDEDEEVVEKAVEEVKDDELTGDEIAALKRLAANADRLIGLLTDSDEEKLGDECGTEDEDEVIDEEEEVDEKIIDTDEDIKEMTKDSRRSMGALERKRVRQDDSLSDPIADAWQKRYGGNK